MNKQIQKANENVRLSNLLFINEILRLETEGRLLGQQKFENDLMKIQFYLKANENWNLDETHILLTESKLKFKNKYEFFEKLSGYKETQIKLFLRIAKKEGKVIDNYKKYCLKNEINPTLEGLDKLERESKKEKTNVTKEGITENSVTEKPKKIVTDAKNIEGKFNKGCTREEVIIFMQKVMNEYKITIDELMTTNEVEALAC